MDTADEIDWQGDSQERFVERVGEIEAWGIYHGNTDLGKRYADEVLKKIAEVAGNLNQYQVQDATTEERSAPFSKGVVVYKKVPIPRTSKFKLLIIDVRNSY